MLTPASPVPLEGMRILPTVSPAIDNRTLPKPSLRIRGADWLTVAAPNLGSAIV
jgi:hypothetical protein